MEAARRRLVIGIGIVHTSHTYLSLYFREETVVGLPGCKTPDQVCCPEWIGRTVRVGSLGSRRGAER